MASKSATSNLDEKSILYMFLLALQFGLQPTITRKFTSDGVSRSTVVLMQEILKFLLAATMLRISGNFRSAVSGWTVPIWLSVALVPAGFYAVQNIATLTAYQNMDGFTYNVLNQTKTLSAALCCYLVMGRKQSSIQIASLFLLLLAALVMEGVVSIGSQLQANEDDKSKESNHWTLGVAPCLLASFLSGLSGALSQKNLQAQGGGRNPFLFSMELCVASALILSISLLVSPDGKQIMEQGFWYGWTSSTWIPIFSNSVGGILVGLVTKYAGSVRKGFALIFGMFLSGVVQAMIQTDGGGMSKEKLVGGILAAISLWLHATNPPTASSKTKAD